MSRYRVGSSVISRGDENTDFGMRSYDFTNSAHAVESGTYVAGGFCGLGLRIDEFMTHNT